MFRDVMGFRFVTSFRVGNTFRAVNRTFRVVICSGFISSRVSFRAVFHFVA